MLFYSAFNIVFLFMITLVAKKNGEQYKEDSAKNTSVIKVFTSDERFMLVWAIFHFLRPAASYHVWYHIYYKKVPCAMRMRRHSGGEIISE